MPQQINITPPCYFKQEFFYGKKIFIAFEYDHSTNGENITQETGNYVTFCLCHSGSAVIRVNNYTRELTAGAQLAITPRTHTTILSMSHDFNCSVISFNPEFRHKIRYTNRIPLVDALMFFKEQSILNLPATQQDFFIKMRDIIATAICTVSAPYRHTLLEELTQSFLLWQQSVIASALNSSAVANSNEVLVTRFMALVNDNYRSRHRLEFYADQMCITPKYLSTTTKLVTGHTATQWINIFLIGEAQDLLAYSNQSVAEISDALGFSNQSFFGKFFKRHTGKSPLAYRLNKESAC